MAAKSQYSFGALGHGLRRLLGPTLHYLVIILSSIGVLALILWNVPWTGSLLQQWGILSQQTTDSIVSAVLFIILTFIIDISYRIYTIEKKMLPDQKHLRIIGGGHYFAQAEVLDFLQHERRSQFKTLEVFGLTFHEFWPKLEQWLDRAQNTSDWQITLYFISPRFCRRRGEELPDYWESDAKASEEKMKRWCQRKENMLAQNRTGLRILPYNTIPVVHGIKLGAGSLYMHTLNWAEDQKFAYPYQAYEYIDIDDNSETAQIKRALFDNWSARISNSAEDETLFDNQNSIK